MQPRISTLVCALFVRCGHHDVAPRDRVEEGLVTDMRAVALVEQLTHALGRQKTQAWFMNSLHFVKPVDQPFSGFCELGRDSCIFDYIQPTTAIEQGLYLQH